MRYSLHELKRGDDGRLTRDLGPHVDLAQIDGVQPGWIVDDPRIGAAVIDAAVPVGPELDEGGVGDITGRRGHGGASDRNLALLAGMRLDAHVGSELRRNGERPDAIGLARGIKRPRDNSGQQPAARSAGGTVIRVAALTPQNAGGNGGRSSAQCFHEKFAPVHTVVYSKASTIGVSPGMVA